MTLACTDVPGAPNANPALVNDLDLIVSVGDRPAGGRLSQPLLSVANVMATEVGDNSDGLLEPCEQGALMLGLRNDGTPAAGLSATLTALTPEVSIITGTTVTADTNGVPRLTGGGSSVYGSRPFSGFGSGPALCVFRNDIDLRTEQSAPPHGILTQVTGSAPNRQWIIEWRGGRFGTPEKIRVAVVWQEGTNRFPQYRQVLLLVRP